MTIYPSNILYTYIPDFRLNKRLTELESKYRIATRWNRSDAHYGEVKIAYLKEMQQRLKASLWAAVSRRHYLLKMKAKYAGKRCGFSNIIIILLYIYIYIIIQMARK